MDDTTYDVVILGLGPVGCTAAILLAHHGLRVAAIERDEEVYRLPRAVNLDGEIIRALQPVGLADAVNALMQPLRPGERAGFANSKREFLFGNTQKDFGVNGWKPINMFDQPELEGFLRSTALAQDNVHAFIGYEATQFTDHGDGVAVAAQKNDGFESTDQLPRQVKGAYLLACDGASSFTRKTLNIGWHNLGYNHDWLVVDVITKPGHTLGLDTLQVCSPDRITTYVATKDPYRRWEFKLNEGETWEEMLDEKNIRTLIDEWTPRDTYEIRRAAMYQFHAATADTWRVGRVFIAGDAAHQTPPFLGQGMNAGMRDVINICWKLPMILNGQADDGLLDTYQAERDAHAHDLVEWAVSIGQLMDHLAAVEAAQRAGLEPPETPEKLRSAGYGQGREQPPLRAGVLIAEQVSQDGVTGHLLSQPLLRASASTQDRRLDDLLGPGFAIVGKTQADLALSPTSADIAAALDARLVSLEHLETSRGHIDRAFNFTDALIVRPDRCVFGHVDDEHTLDDLMAALAEKLCLRY